MKLPIGADLRPSARTGIGTPGVGGMVLAAVGTGTVVAGLLRRSLLGAAVALVGVGVAYLGLTGMSLLERLRDGDAASHPRFRLSMPMRPSGSTMATSTITINRELEPVFLFWRNPANLALLHGPIANVTPAGDGLERWWIDGRGGVGTTLDMRLIEEVPLERVAWRSADDSGASFSVELRAAPRGGTEVHLAARIPRQTTLPRPLGGLLAPAARAQLDGMLRRARALIEAGEIATTAGQPSGRDGPPTTPVRGSNLQ
jgi:uncharacterized membrane protein